MLISNPKDLTISDLLTGDVELASLPQIFYEFKKVVNDPDKSISDAAFLIEKDTALAFKLLKIVNSAFYGYSANITSISKASIIIGANELQNLVTSTVVLEKFSDMPDDTLSMYDFWANSLHCALFAKNLDQFLAGQYEESIFLCGLFHDIGQLVFYRRLPVLAREVELTLQTKDQLAFDDEALAEEKTVGFNHFDIGAELCRLWNFPEIIIESIRLHMHIDITCEYTQISSIVRFANHYCKYKNNEDLAGNEFGISNEDMTKILEQTSSQFDEIFKIFFSN